MVYYVGLVFSDFSLATNPVFLWWCYTSIIGHMAVL